MSFEGRSGGIRRAAVALFVLACLSAWTFVLDEGSEMSVDATAAPSPRVVVDGNADLISQATANGWPGGGTTVNPYIIEYLTIVTTGAQCIYISNTDLHFVIRHCDLNSTFYAISLINVQNVVIENNTIVSSGHGIYAESSHFLVIEHNNCTRGSAYSDIIVGISLYECTDSTIRANAVTGFGGGIIVGAGSALNVTLNNVYDVYTGVGAIDLENSSITNNTLLECFGRGIKLTRLNGVTASGNLLTGRLGGIEVNDWNTDLMVANNTLLSSYDWHGVLLSSAYNVTLRDNEMVDSGVVIEGQLVEQWTSHDIDSSNKVNNSPVIYLANATNATVPIGAGQVILANCSGMTLENATISNGSVAVSLGFSNNCTIANCTLASRYDGIRMYRSQHNTVEKNLLEVWVGSTISLIESSMNVIANNTCTSTQEWILQAISLSLSDDNLIKDNNCSGMMSYSINLAWSERNTVVRNICLDASFSGIYLQSSKNNSIDANLCGSTPQAGIGLANSDNNSITGNTCINNTNFSDVSPAAGISLYLSSNNSLVGNDCQINSAGIVLEFSNNTRVAYNICNDNFDHGILISTSIGCALTSNILTGNGIDFDSADMSYWTANSIDSTNFVNGHPVAFLANQDSKSVTGELGEVILANCTSIDVNEVSLFGKGSTMVLAFTNLTSISDSSFENCTEGIHVMKSDRNVMENNTFLNCTGPAIYIHSGTGNIIFNNTFKDNNGVREGVHTGGTQAMDSGDTNWWNSTSYGNHWNDWTSPDHNHDGIVDSPYEIGGFAGSKDYYPYASVKENPFPWVVVASAAVLIIMAAIVAIIFRRRKAGKDRKAPEAEVLPDLEDAMKPGP